MPSLESMFDSFIGTSQINIRTILLLSASMVALTVSMVACRNRKKKKNQTEKRRVVPVRVQSSADLYDAGQDAKIRHQSQEPMFPKLLLQKQSITNANYRSAKRRLGYRKHDPNDFNMPFNPPTRFTTPSVKFAKECLVYVVYENDAARGELEKEETTLDPQPVNETANDAGNQDLAVSITTGGSNEAAGE